MEFVNPKTGELSGFDIDLGKAIAAKLGLKDRWSQAAFANCRAVFRPGAGSDPFRHER